MEITCPNCKLKRTIDDSRLPPERTKISTLCKSCGHRFTLFVEAGARPQAPEPAEAPAGTASSQSIPPRKEVTRRPEPDARPAARPASRPAQPSAPAESVAPDPDIKPRPKPVSRIETRSIGVILSKGGVGKTTTSVNLSAGLALAGYKVLLVDTDTQGQSSYMLGVKPEVGLAELVTKEMDAQSVVFKARENLWLLAGGRSLAGVKRFIDRKDFGGELTLTEALQPIESLFDFVIVDSSPGWDPITVNVLFYVKEILVPVSLEVMSLQGLSEFTKSLTTIQKYRKRVGITYILPTFLDDKIASREDILVKLKGLYKGQICQPIRFDPSLSEAPAYGQTIFEYDSGCSGVADYKALVRRLTDGSALL